MTDKPGAKIGAAAGGALVGGLLTGGSGFGIKAGWVVGQAAIGLLGGGGEETVVLDRVTEFRFSGSAFGAPIPTVDGADVVQGQIFYIGQVRAVREERTTGGKGPAGPETTTVSFRYEVDMGVLLCEAPAEGMSVLKVWEGPDRKLVLDYTAGAGPAAATLANGASAAAHIRIHSGADSQRPDPTMQAQLGIDDTSAYRRLTWLMLHGYPAGEGGQFALPAISALVATKTTGSKPSTIVDPPISTRLQGAVILPHLQRLITGAADTNVVVFDLVDKTVIASSNTLEFNDGFGVDAAGDIYVVDKISGDDAVRKYDGLSLAEVATGTTGTNDTNYQMIVAGEPPFETLLIAVSSVTSIFRNIVAVDTTTLRIIALHGKPKSGLTDPHGWTKDRDGNPWLAAQDPTTTPDSVWLAKLDPRSGVPVETFSVDVPVIDLIGYDPNTHSIILVNVGSPDAIYRWNIDSETLDGELQVNINSAGTARMAFQNGPRSDSHIWFKNSDNSFREVNLATMENVAVHSNDDWDGIGLPTIDGTIYDPINNAVIRDKQVESRHYWMYLDRVDPDTILLKDLLERHSARVAFDLATQVDASDRVEAVNGLKLKRRDRKRAQLDPMQPAFLFDTIEEDRGAGTRVVFPKRGGAVTAQIPVAELGARPAGAAWQPPIDFRVTGDAKLPEVLEVSYTDKDLDYQVSVEQAVRDAAGINSDEVEGQDYSQLVFTAQEAARLAETVLWAMALDGIPVAFTMLPGRRRHSPGDVIELLGPTTTFRVRAKTITRQPTGAIAVEALFDQAPVYASTAAGVGADAVPLSQIRVLGISIGLIADAPSPGPEAFGIVLFLGARRLTGTTFPGASIRSSGDGDVFVPFAGIESTAEMTAGTALNALADADPAFTDRTSQLDVRLWAGATLASFTEADIMADREKGAFLMESGGAWEWGQYADATLQADGSYRLTTLLRGRNNTENHTGNHAEGDRVWFPTRASLKSGSLTAPQLRQTRLYKTVTLGLPAAQGSLNQVNAIGRSRMPYQPWFKSQSIGGGGRTVTFERQDILPPADIFWTAPLSEATEDYEGDLLDDMGAVALPITTTASANGSVITVADPPTLFVDDDDLTGITLPATVRLYQLSAEPVGPAGTGRGEPLTIILE